ncbi:MAG TPA: hypothetical protein VKX17_18925 [Planctomycetota bacterium]|nr:hypothetical protein [Planctomycetota bacterium]
MIAFLGFSLRDVLSKLRNKFARQRRHAVALLPLSWRQEKSVLGEIADCRVEDGTRPIAGDEQCFENDRVWKLAATNVIVLSRGCQKIAHLIWQ